MVDTAQYIDKLLMLNAQMLEVMTLAISCTPTGPTRNKLTDIAIVLMVIENQLEKLK